MPAEGGGLQVSDFHFRCQGQEDVKQGRGEGYQGVLATRYLAVRSPSQLSQQLPCRSARLSAASRWQQPQSAY